MKERDAIGPYRRWSFSRIYSGHDRTTDRGVHERCGFIRGDKKASCPAGSLQRAPVYDIMMRRDRQSLENENYAEGAARPARLNRTSEGDDFIKISNAVSRKCGEHIG